MSRGRVELELFLDKYSNFNAGKILLILEGIGGEQDKLKIFLYLIDKSWQD